MGVQKTPVSFRHPWKPSQIDPTYYVIRLVTLSLRPEATIPSRECAQMLGGFNLKFEV